MQAELERVLELQAQYSWQNSPAMQERGMLVRTQAASWLQDHGPRLASGMGIDDFFSEGSDGKGRKNRVPWVRFGSWSRTPHATNGFYAVYLFGADGEAVYLSLNQGTSDFVGGDLVDKSPAVLAERVAWARDVIGHWLASRPDVVPLELHDPRRGAAYERGDIASVAYSRRAVPPETTLRADAQSFAEALGQLYAEHSLRPLPDEQPEVEAAIGAADEVAGNERSTSAGFRTDAEEIRLIEDHAVRLARTYYEREGWDVSVLGKPYDLEVGRGNERLTVEVKGTTSTGSGVPLTANEVTHQMEAHPDNALVVVREIGLDRSVTPPRVFGGTLYEHRGWSIDPAALKVISYKYTVPSIIYEGRGIPADSLR